MSPPTDDVAVGRIAGAFGVRGELKCDPTSAGRTVFFAGSELRCTRGGDSSTVRIASVRPHKNRLLICIDGVDGPEAAQDYVGAVLHAARDRVALREGEYLDADLVGCAVYGTDGREHGTVERVEHYPASDMLVVGGRMVPMVAAIVTSIELAERRIVIDPPAGLLDE
ncbi:MAG TPA: ribosome maturation factor RimM [Candidatus Dormibacteraeota bacterium]|nr:ribosome maturation factor RimM [Candidatus Dormibacteraeota bacterium]